MNTYDFQMLCESKAKVNLGKVEAGKWKRVGNGVEKGAKNCPDYIFS